MPDDQDLRNLIGRVRSANCEPGGDVGAFTLAIEAGKLLHRLTEVGGERDKRAAYAQRMLELAGSWEAKNNTLAAENARLRKVAEAAKAFSAARGLADADEYHRLCGAIDATVDALQEGPTGLPGSTLPAQNPTARAGGKS